MARSGCLLSAVFLLAAGGFYVNGFPYGAPETTCSTMKPKHGFDAQTSEPPYQITTSASTYSPGQNITGIVYRNVA